MNLFKTLILFLLASSTLLAVGTLKVFDINTNEPLISASVQFVNLNPSKADSNFRKTDSYGSVRVPYDSAIARVSYLGYEPNQTIVYKNSRNQILLNQVSILYS
ncbi:MAG: hypothetical protein RIF34_05440, partial [Candidatus Kapaibacterium sp.]